MMDPVRLERFLRDAHDVRLGNVASDLERLGSWVSRHRSDAAVLDMMDEIAAMLEHVGEPVAETIADVQREIRRWRRIWPLEEARSLLAFRAHMMSRQLLDLSGLVSADR